MSDVMYVIPGPAFSASSIPTIGKDVLAVPEYAWKALYEPGIGAAAYGCTNDDDETCNAVSINDVITLAGVDPSPMLGSAIKSNPLDLPLP
jgi:endonuclease G